MSTPTQHRRRREVGAPTVKASAAASVEKDSNRTPLFTVRESDEYDLFMFQGMLDQVLRPHLAVPGVADVLKHGADIMRNTADGAALRRQWNAIKVTHAKRFVGWRVKRGNAWFFLAMQSAASINDGGENAYTEALAKLIRDLAPERHITGPFTRVVRNDEVAGRVAQAYREMRCPLYCSEVPGGIEVWTDGGRMLWGVMVQVASFEHRAIVRRMLAGTLYQLKLGGWPKAEEHLPLGFKLALTKANERLVKPDPEMREAVAEMVRLGGTELSNKEIAKRLGEKYGVTSRKLQSYHGDDSMTVADARDPNTAMKMRYRHLRTYLTGTYTFTQACPERGVESMFGCDVHLDVDEKGAPIAGSEHFRFEIPFGGGPELWGVTEEQIELAYRKRVIEPPSKRGRHGGHNTEKVKPLAGVCEYEEDGFAYCLRCERAAFYRLYRRTVSAAVNSQTGRRRGWDRTDTGVKYVAGFPSHWLHRPLADLIIEALESGVPGELVALSVASDADEDRKEALLAQLNELREARTNHEANARGLGLLAAKALEQGREADAEDYEAQRAEEKAAADNLAPKIAKREQDLLAPRPVPSGAEGQFGDLARVVAYLRQCKDQGPVAVNDALLEIITDMRFSEITPVSALLTVKLVVPTTDGPVELGPLSVVVARRGRTGRKGCPDAGLAARRAEFAKMYLSEARSIADIAKTTGWDTTVTERYVSEWLGEPGLDGRPRVPSKGLRAAIMDCPVPDVRRALGAHLFGTPLPEGIAPGWAEHVLRTYTTDVPWALSWAADTHRQRRAVVAYVAAHDAGRGVAVGEVEQVLGVDHWYLLDMLHDVRRAGNATPAYRPCLQRVGAAEWDRWTSDSDKRVRLLACPHCGGRASHVLRVPEVPACVLCPQCARMPGHPSLVFGPEYFKNWEGPRGRGDGHDARSGGTSVAA